MVVLCRRNAMFARSLQARNSRIKIPDFVETKCATVVICIPESGIVTVCLLQKPPRISPATWLHEVSKGVAGHFPESTLHHFLSNTSETWNSRKFHSGIFALGIKTYQKPLRKQLVLFKVCNCRHLHSRIWNCNRGLTPKVSFRDLTHPSKTV